MKALVFRGPGQKAIDDNPEPTIQHPSDAVVRITKTTICSADLHLFKGDVPEVKAGTTLGHEGGGAMESVGNAVANFKVGDAVLVSCISSCGKCEFCRRQMYPHCTTGGWILGHLIDGTPAEKVRIPHADTSLYHIPAGSDDEALVMLSDILPTGFGCGVLNGKVKPGCSVAIVGAGPVGLAALMMAQFYAPATFIAIDLDDNRLSVAKTFGETDTINSSGGTAVDDVMALTHGRGVDVSIEAVGIPATFAICEGMVRTGGTIANVGVHGTKVDLHLKNLWAHNITFITLTIELVDTYSTPMRLSTVVSKRLEPKKLVTHRFKLDAIMNAYPTFADAARSEALKVVISA